MTAAFPQEFTFAKNLRSAISNVGPDISKEHGQIFYLTTAFSVQIKIGQAISPWVDFSPASSTLRLAMQAAIKIMVADDLTCTEIGSCNFAKIERKVEFNGQTVEVTIIHTRSLSGTSQTNPGQVNGLNQTNQVSIEDMIETGLVNFFSPVSAS